MLKPRSGMLRVLAPRWPVSLTLWFGLFRPPTLAPSGAADALQPSRPAAPDLVQTFPRPPDSTPPPRVTA